MAQTRLRRARGFTLVELLVALFVLSLVAVLSWRGLDGMVRTQSQVQTRADEVMRSAILPTVRTLLIGVSFPPTHIRCTRRTPFKLAKRQRSPQGSSMAS